MPTPNSSPIRVILIDDHTIVRAGLRMLLGNAPNLKVVGEAGNRADALALAASQQTDIILLDLDIEGESSLDFMQEMMDLGKDAKIVVLTGLRDSELHRRAIRLGAMGLVMKDKAAEVLIKAIERVHAGEVWLDRSMTASMLNELRRSRAEAQDDPDKAKIATLTEREREIIHLVCQGLKNKRIGERLFISEATVRNHLTSILSKLDLSDRFELALFSYRHGLGKPPQ